MTKIEIEKRLEILETEVALLKGKIRTPADPEKPWYKQIPKFGGNAAYEEASRLGREFRESQIDAGDDK